MNIKSTVATALNIFFLSIFVLSAAPTSGFSAESATTYSFQADGLACPFCAYGIEKQVQKIQGVASVATDIASGKVLITVRDDATLEEGKVNEAVKKAGFTMRAFKKE